MDVRSAIKQCRVDEAGIDGNFLYLRPPTPRDVSQEAPSEPMRNGVTRVLTKTCYFYYYYYYSLLQLEQEQIQNYQIAQSKWQLPGWLAGPTKQSVKGRATRSMHDDDDYDDVSIRWWWMV